MREVRPSSPATGEPRLTLQASEMPRSFLIETGQDHDTFKLGVFGTQLTTPRGYNRRGLMWQDKALWIVDICHHRIIGRKKGKRERRCRRVVRRWVTDNLLRRLRLSGADIDLLRVHGKAPQTREIKLTRHVLASSRSRDSSCEGGIVHDPCASRSCLVSEAYFFLKLSLFQ